MQLLFRQFSRAQKFAKTFLYVDAKLIDPKHMMHNMTQILFKEFRTVPQVSKNYKMMTHLLTVGSGILLPRAQWLFTVCTTYSKCKARSTGPFLEWIIIIRNSHDSMTQFVQQKIRLQNGIKAFKGRTIQADIDGTIRSSVCDVINATSRLEEIIVEYFHWTTEQNKIASIKLASVS